MDTLSAPKLETQKITLVDESRFSRRPDWLAWLIRYGWLALPLVIAILLGTSIARENWLVLLAVAGLGLVLLWPVSVTLGLFAFLVPFDVVSVVGGGEGTTLTFYAGAAAGVALVGTALLRKRIERPLPMAIWWFGFVAWAGTTLLWAHDGGRAMARLPSALVLVLFTCAAASVRITRKELSWISIGTVGGGCLAGAYCIKEYFSGQFYHSVTSGRSTLALGGSSVDPNFFAASLFLPLALAMGYFLLSKGWVHRGLAMAAGGTIVFAIFTTMSRGAVVALAVMLFVFIRRIGLSFRVLVATGLILLAVLAVSNRLLARIETIDERGGSGRLWIWPVGLAALKHVGLQGAGLDNFRTAYMEYLVESGVKQVRTYNEIDAHNVYLATWVELGIPGIGCMLMAFVSMFRSARRARTSGEQSGWLVPFEAAAWAMLTSCFFVGLQWQKSFWLLWILFGLAIRVLGTPSDADEVRPAGLGRAAMAPVSSLR